MKTLLRNLFLNNWQRKCISIALSVIIWMVVNHTLTTTRTVSNIPVRVVNIPSGKTVDGLQANGFLSKRIALTLIGNQSLLEDLTSNDLEVVIDAADKPDEWIASITKNNIVSLSPEIDLSKGISRVTHQSFIVRLTKLITEKIPVLVTQPIGEAPRNYQFLDVWPYHLTFTVSGPEDVIKRLKTKGVKLTFNLSDISKSMLDNLPSKDDNADEVSYFIPDQWKNIHLPLISDAPIEIDDTKARALRIDFVRCTILPIENPIPVTLFYPPEHRASLNPNTLSLTSTDFLKAQHGLYFTPPSLYAKGVSRLFLDIVKDMLQIEVIARPKSEGKLLDWSVQFVNAKMLEDRYVSTVLSDSSDDEMGDLSPRLRQEYLRNRFRSYMQRFQLYQSADTKLELNIEREDNTISVTEAIAFP